MRSNKAKLMIRAMLLVALLFGGVLSTTAAAQHRIRNRPVVIYRPFRTYRPFWGPRWGWGPYWGSTLTVVDPIAQQRESGYSDGHKRGKDDAKHGKANAPASHKHYSNSHSLTYRQAFLRGYADGYREQRDKLG